MTGSLQAVVSFDTTKEKQTTDEKEIRGRYVREDTGTHPGFQSAGLDDALKIGLSSLKVDIMKPSVNFSAAQNYDDGDV